ncbi:MAG: NUDIX domain-containing protein [Chitinophagaceae bacterium]
MAEKNTPSRSKKSAGILLYRLVTGTTEVLLVHPGGPFWSKKDLGAWSIPKGEFDDHENPFDAAIREMEEETGLSAFGELIELTPVKQKSGKLVYAWALQKNIDPGKIKSNHFEMEWPPKSGTKRSFPEIDKAAWYELGEAKKKIIEAQASFITELELKLK